jgi:antitoxin MazE
LVDLRAFPGATVNDKKQRQIVLTSDSWIETENGARMKAENDGTVSETQTKTAREGWAEASKDIAETGDDALLIGEFDNSNDAEPCW